MEVPEAKTITWEQVIKGGKGASQAGELQSLLQNKAFREIYESLENGTEARKLAKELTIEEEACIKFYTNKSYYEFNKALLDGSKSDDIIAIEKLLNNILNKLESVPGKYYRGIGKNEIEMLDNLKVGNIITYKNFLSTSSDIDISREFARKNYTKTGKGAMIEVYSKNAKDIKKISDLEKESELLHHSNSKFQLEEIKENILLNVYEYQFDFYPAVYRKTYILRQIE